MFPIGIKVRYLRLESTTKKLVVVGNFKNEQINTGVYFGNTGDWYELNGETLNVTNSSEQPVVIPANSLQVIHQLSSKQLINGCNSEIHHRKQPIIM